MQTIENKSIERTVLTPFETLDENVRLQEKEEVVPQTTEEPIERETFGEYNNEPEVPEIPEVPESSSEELEYDVKISGNPIKVIANDWKSKGYLPEEFEVADNITEEQLEEVYRTHKEALIESEIRTRVLDELKAEGVDDDIIETAKLLKHGVPQEQISQADAYQVLGSVQLDPEDENYEGYAKQVLAQYYADKGFSSDKISRYVERDMEDEDVESLVGEAQEHFKVRASQMKQHFAQVEAQKAAQEQQRVTQTVESMNQFIERGEIAGRKYSKEQMTQVKRALFEKTEVVVDAQGNRRRVTAYEKKRLEYQNNFELNFKSVVDFILGYDAQAIEAEGKLKGKSEALRELNKQVQVTIKGVREINKDNIERRELA